MILLELLLCRRFHLGYLVDSVEGGCEGIADVGKPVAGFLQAFELLVEEREKLGGVHVADFVSEATQHV
jgi:hypothetical protein